MASSRANFLYQWIFGWKNWVWERDYVGLTLRDSRGFIWTESGSPMSDLPADMEQGRSRDPMEMEMALLEEGNNREEGESSEERGGTGSDSSSSTSASSSPPPPNDSANVCLGRCFVVLAVLLGIFCGPILLTFSTVAVISCLQRQECFTEVVFLVLGIALMGWAVAALCIVTNLFLRAMMKAGLSPFKRMLIVCSFVLICFVSFSITAYLSLTSLDNKAAEDGYGAIASDDHGILLACCAAISAELGLAGVFVLWMDWRHHPSFCSPQEPIYHPDSPSSSSSSSSLPARAL